MTTTTDSPAKAAGRAYIGHVEVRIGMLSTTGNIYTVEIKEDEGFKTLCPDCKAPTGFLSQRYVCNDNAKHGPFQLAEVAYGRQDGDGKIIKVDADKVKEARTSVLPEKTLELQVHSRDEVQNHTFAKGNVYVFLPTGSNLLYGVLVDILKKRRDIIFLAKTNLRNKDHFVMVDLEFGQLVIREMLWPADVKSFAPVEAGESSEKLLAQAEMLIDSMIEPFDMTEYSKDSRQRIAAVIEEATAGTPAKDKKKVAPKKVAEEDFAELLAQSIALQKAKPVRRKKAS